jgi:hypothetical protein
MRRSMEPLLYAAGVDLVITGHNHVYERINAVHNYQLDPCGINHFVLGDAGNYDGALGMSSQFGYHIVSA